MRESDIIGIINNKIGNKYIGDDCAYLKEMGIVISQDSLVEDIHFNLGWTTPYKLGYKSIAVNISDILASGAVPKYLTISLSLPVKIGSSFIESFYDGAKSALNGAEIIGGDITGSKEKIMISVCAIGDAKGRNISSRSYAKEGYIVITKGNHGSSSAGLDELKNNGHDIELINAHLEPILEYDFSEQISTNVKEPYAMMDTSDGLADALFKIAESSNVRIDIDYEKIRHLDRVTKHHVLFGGEDYKPVAAIPAKYLPQINNAYVIGTVTNFDGTRLCISGEKYNKFSQLDVFNHFGE